MNYIEQLMKENDIEVNEEFYVLRKGRIGDSIGDIKYHFDENYFLVSDKEEFKEYGIMLLLLTGDCQIEKIPQKPKSVWDLKIGDEYWYITLLGYVEEVSYQSDDEDINIIKAGNAFLTKEEAEFEVERRKCEAILLKYGTRDMMSISDDDTNKYFICYNNYVNGIAVNNNQFVNNQGTIYFESKELAQKAIEECGKERLKKYVFNVKE